MRVPVPVVIILSALVVGTTWWLRTHDLDFMKPKGVTPESPGVVMAPPDSTGVDDGPPRTSVSSPRGTPEEDQPPAPEPLDFGDLESAPGLSEYSEHAGKGADYLIRLATELEARGEFQRALLAWERVIDSCRATTDERASAESAVLRLRPTLPHWSIDPSGEIEILLQLGTARRSSEGMTAAAQEVAEFLRRDSDDLCAVTPRLTTGGRKGATEGPIAVYLSGSGEAEETQSSVLSIDPKSDESEEIRRELLTAVYQVLRKSLSGQEGIRLPFPPSHAETPKEDFRRYLTRLHWHYAAEGLAQPPSPDEEEDEDPAPGNSAGADD